MGRIHSYERTQGEVPQESVFKSPWPYLLSGAVIIVASAVLLFGASGHKRDSERALEQGQRVISQLGEPVTLLRNLMSDAEVLARAADALEDTAVLPELTAQLGERVEGVEELRVFPADIFESDYAALGEDAFINLDMMIAAGTRSPAPVQMLRDRGVRRIATAAALPGEEGPRGYLMALARPELVLDRFDATLPEAGYVALEHATGGNAPLKLIEYGAGVPSGSVLMRLNVPGSMFRIAVPQATAAPGLSGAERLATFLVGSLLLALGFVRYGWNRKRVLEPTEEALTATEGQTGAQPSETRSEVKGRASKAALTLTGKKTRLQTRSTRGNAPTDTRTRKTSRGRPATVTGDIGGIPTPHALPTFKGASDEEDTSVPKTFQAFPEEGTLPEYRTMGQTTVGESDESTVELEDLPHALQQREAEQKQHPTTSFGEPVELSGSIFRAYDIRGVVGETLDKAVARQIGQAVGSQAQDSLAEPLVVGRDGRHSGPELVDGLIEGIRSTGCDVIDVGAVPTGALYFATHELASGSGVMVTGSPNPPDYNGFKIMIAGRPLSGDAIYGLFERIQSGNLRIGEGSLEQVEVLESYRNRIAQDIQLDRPLKVVADCGNGIGGSCAADVLRAIGADVMPLFDDVDGDFPNHHPDPSEPENLKDLIASVRLMDADIGVAFDGDADRLGVVTPKGDIVYPDRVMMLYAQEILSRNPGAPIIYDVKCTGHLETVIREAGGKPEMFKTGHSFIKNRMKEVKAPFAGEMSGHFFFQDRWYGFDCGIYSAARLLEILAREELTPQEVLEALPNSVSTPELKVHLEEGENHAFIEAFQAEASFEGARVSTIDGVRADFDDGWGLVRASNTTPVLVLRFDADDEEALKRVQEKFREQLLAVRDDLELPF